MRLARLAALGLAIGVITGFAVALLRPRPRVRMEPPASRPRTNSTAQGDVADSALWERFNQAGTPAGDPSSMVDTRAHRRVTG